MGLDRGERVPEQLDRLGPRRAEAQHAGADPLGECHSGVDGRIGAEELDPPPVGAEHDREHQQADVVMLTRGAGEHGRPTHAAPSLGDQPAEMRAHLGGDRVLLRDRELAAVPRLAGPLERRRHDLRQGLLERKHGKGLVERCRDGARVVLLDRSDQRVAEIGRVVERDRRRLVDHAGCLADPPAVPDPVAQPLDALHVHLAVAPLPAGRADRPEHAVTLLPLAQRVGRDAGPPGECCNVEQGCSHWTIPGRS